MKKHKQRPSKKFEIELIVSDYEESRSKYRLQIDMQTKKATLILDKKEGFTNRNGFNSAPILELGEDRFWETYEPIDLNKPE